MRRLGKIILLYSEGKDNAAAYRTHEMIRDVNEDWLKAQSLKDVKQTLQRWNRLPRNLMQDIHIRSGVLPAPAGEQQRLLKMVNGEEPFRGTKAQLQAYNQNQNQNQN
jgi:hypothetical protein